MLQDPTQSLSLTKGSMVKVKLICDYCGNGYEQIWRNRVNGYKKTPKDSCKNCRNIKREETSLRKYGTRIPSQSMKIRQKASLTKGGSGKCVEEYREEILKLYHADDHVSVNSIAQTLGVTRSVLIPYMVELGLDVRGDISARRQKTTKERYGKEHFLQTKIGQDKFKKVLKDKYGTENPYENPEFKEMVLEKSRKTCKEKYGVEYILQDKNREEEFEKKRSLTRLANGQLIHEGKTAKVLAAEKGMALTSFYQKVQKFGLDTAMKTDKYQSDLELMICQMLDDMNVEYKTEFQVKQKRADFYIPKYNLIVEADGLYWHSDMVIEDDNYHVKKRQLYIDEGYTPLFFRGDEIIHKSSIIKSIIQNKLGQTKKIGARQCQLVELTKKEGSQFMVDNHLMGKGAGDCCALSKDGEIVSCMCVKRVRNNDYEISRFCNKIGYSVQGAFSKLIKVVQDSFPIQTLVTFIDRRYGQGDYLEKLGFSFIGSHKSFKWTNGKESCHRMRFKGNTGYEEGYAKIFDAGQAKYLKLAEDNPKWGEF